MHKYIYIYIYIFYFKIDTIVILFKTKKYVRLKN